MRAKGEVISNGNQSRRLWARIKRKQESSSAIIAVAEGILRGFASNRRLINWMVHMNLRNSRRTFLSSSKNTMTKNLSFFIKTILDKGGKENRTLVEINMGQNRWRTEF